jgi:creatinine amidohydrolase
VTEGARAHRLAALTTDELATVLASRTAVALLPVGSVEPHGPHLPLATDTLISERVAAAAAERLNDEAHRAFVCPSVPYGVTNYAAGFAGAITVPQEALVAFLKAVVGGYLDTGFAHVCLVNNHLEPDHDAAIRAAAKGFDAHAVSIACPLTRRWGRTLSDEYKSGACHAGRYETSLVLEAAPAWVKREAAEALPALTVSLSDGIRAGKKTFADMGLDRAYTGAPAEASAEEGRDLVERLATMVVTEVTEALAKSPES